MRPIFLLLAMLLGLAIAFLLFISSPAIRDALNRGRQRFYLWNLRLLADLAGATMVAGTAITILDRPGGFHFQIQFSLDPGNIAAGGREVETVAVPCAAIGDVVVLSPRYATSLIVGYARVSAAGVITFSLENNTAGALDEGNNIWDCMIIRGSTGPLR
jgi:hypothetical protein